MTNRARYTEFAEVTMDDALNWAKNQVPRLEVVGQDPLVSINQRRRACMLPPFKLITREVYREPLPKPGVGGPNCDAENPELDLLKVGAMAWETYPNQRTERARYVRMQLPPYHMWKRLIERMDPDLLTKAVTRLLSDTQPLDGDAYDEARTPNGMSETALYERSKLNRKYKALKVTAARAAE